MDKRGFISINNKIVCNRMGLTPEILVSSGDYIEINTKNAYTVSKMSPGIILSFYSVPVNEAKKELVWFTENKRAYFLSSQNKIDAFRSFWKGYSPFGELLSKKYLMSLDTRYSWTFFLYHKIVGVLSEDIRPPKSLDDRMRDRKAIQYVLTTLWDIERQIFITPENWPRYLNPRKWSRAEDNIWNVDDLSYLSAAKSTRFIFPDWVATNSSAVIEKMNENVITIGDKGIRVFSGEPLLITIYCGDVIYTCRILVKQDLAINTILSRSLDKFECLLIAIFREENVELFEKRYFTQDELKRFYDKLAKGKKYFFKQIYDKVELAKFTNFPDKLFGALGLQRILNSNFSCSEKQEMAWKKLCGLACCKSWKYSVISVFYNHYMM